VLGYEVARKLTYDEAKLEFEKRGYKLLENDYINNSTKMRYRCPSHPNEKLNVSFASFKKGSGCPICAGNVKPTFNEVYKYYKSYGCTLLENRYVNANAVMSYLCSCGNKSSSSFSKFKAGNKGCRKCSQIKKKGLLNVKVKEYTKQDLIDEFWRFYKEHEVYPRTEDLKYENGYPAYFLYYRTWGSWTNFLKYELDILGDNAWYKYDEEILIKMYETNPKEQIIEFLMVKRKWEQIIKKAKKLGLKRNRYADNNKPEINKEYLIECFWNFYSENKRYPLTKDFIKSNKKHPGISTFKRHFETWDNYLKEVGVIDKNTTDGWYIHDEAILRKYYPDNKINEIIEKLMVKRNEPTIRQKANKLGLKIKKELRYIPKYANDETRALLKKEAKDFYINNGRSPNRKDFSLPRNAIEQNWDSYNDFLIECGLPIFRRHVELKDTEDGINFLQKLSEELGRNPTVNDVCEYGVNKGWFANIFGSYTKALYAADLIPIENVDKEVKIEKSVEGFKELYNSLGKVPMYADYKKYASDNELMTAYNLMEKLNISSYTELCKYIVGESNRTEYSEEELISGLKILKEKLGRVPMGVDLVPNSLPSLQIYKTFFKKRYFNDIIRELGWEPYGHDPLYKTEEEMLDDYYTLYLNLGRIPLGEDIGRTNGMTSYATYKEKFGDVIEICKLLNIDISKHISELNFGAGNIYFDKNGEICRSYPELIISNALISNKINFIKEYEYNNIIQCNSKINMDWYLPDVEIAVEYFGLYDKRRKNNDDRNGLYTRKADMKIELCEKNNVKLISIFPKDVRYNYKKVEKKFDKYGISLDIESDLNVMI
jgi:hypothetical protein